jgi:hypothetical protein
MFSPPSLKLSDRMIIVGKRIHDQFFCGSAVISSLRQSGRVFWRLFYAFDVKYGDPKVPSQIPVLSQETKEKWRF